MLYVELEKLTEKSAILELARNLRKHYEKTRDWPAFNMYLRSFHMTQNFLTEIWDRILQDIQLGNKYWNIQAELHYSELQDEYDLSEEDAKILEEYSKHEYRLNLDVEDWFLHAHILMEKYVKLFKLIMILISGNEQNEKGAHELPNRSFDRHFKYFLRLDKKGIADETYLEIIKASVSWYYSDLKDVRDDLIEHEQIGRFWGSGISPGHFSISRFRRTDAMTKKLYELRDKYQKAYTILQGQVNIYELMNFFETNILRLEPVDVSIIKGIRKGYGRDFPDIPTLYSKMNRFFSAVNDYFVSKEKMKPKAEPASREPLNP